MIKTWHWRLKHPSYINLKRLGHSKGIDLSKLKVDKNSLLCKICIQAKQKRKLSLKLHTLLNAISEEPYDYFIGSITPKRYNSCKHSLCFTDSHSRCWLVYNLNEKQIIWPAIRKCVIFTKNQTEKSVKCLRLGEKREFSVSGLEEWTSAKEIEVEFTVNYSPEMNYIVERTNVW